ncbi:hypothetical protein SAMN05444161_8300 [Rhizobiales bacterium GAS191]|nr:hypothetical protein SAMN05444161_8300 [Rhizobiales bacterium GAS191]
MPRTDDGKTTLAAILRSLQTGDAAPIAERHRLGSLHPPHVVIGTGGAAPSIFQMGAWSTTQLDLAIFDDHFVAANVCSGLAIEAGHRQNLHELILGAQGVALSTALQMHIASIEEHNRALRDKERAIPAAARGALSVDAFCALEPIVGIDTAIQDAERSLAAAKSAEAVRQRPEFAPIAPPSFDLTAIEALLQRGLPELDADASARVQTHLTGLGRGAEAWVGEGMPRIKGGLCPFCAQGLGASPVIGHYRAYFSEGYASLKKSITDQIAAIGATHAGDAPAAFERAVRMAVQATDFWQAFMSVPAFEIDTAAVVRVWNAAREAVLGQVRAKQAAPLDPMTLSPKTCAAVASYDEARSQVVDTSAALHAINLQIALVKERAASANVSALTADLGKLTATRSRYEPVIAGYCQAYLDEKAAKTATEALRDQARTAIDGHRQFMFAAYEAAINRYLAQFNAGFRLASVSSVNTRGGSACSYAVVINNVLRSIDGARRSPPAWQEADDHERGQGLAGIAGLPQGDRAWLSA